MSLSVLTKTPLGAPADSLSGPSAMAQKSAHGDVDVVKRSLAAYDLVKR